MNLGGKCNLTSQLTTEKTLNIISIIDTAAQLVFLPDVVDTNTKSLFLSVTLRILEERLRILLISALKLRAIILIASRGSWRWPHSCYLSTH